MSGTFYQPRQLFSDIIIKRHYQLHSQHTCMYMYMYVSYTRTDICTYTMYMSYTCTCHIYVHVTLLDINVYMYMYMYVSFDHRFSMLHFHNHTCAFFRAVLRSLLSLSSSLFALRTSLSLSPCSMAVLDTSLSLV